MATISDDIQILLICFLLWLIPTLLLRFVFKRSTTSTTHLRLPPSPPALPIIGHVHHLTLAVFKCFHHLSSKYGPLLYLRLGSYPLVLVSSSSMAAEIFKTNDLNFASRPKSPFPDGLLFGNSGLATVAYGDYWRFMKKLCVSELLSLRQIERSRSVRREELTRFLHKILEKAQKNEVLNVGTELVRLTNNSTCRMVMSTRCSGEDNEAEKCRELVKQSFEVAAKTTLANCLGPFRKLGFWFFKKQCTDVPRRFDELLEKLLKEHEETAKRCGEREDKDLMDILLDVYQDKDAGVKLRRSQIKAFLLDLFLGGTSTSADTMQWAMTELMNHPDVFKKLRKEIDSVVGKKRLVEDSDMSSLHFLQAVVKETLRLHPPVPVIPRFCHENCKIKGFEIPKETAIAINTYSIMRDPEFWDNPDEFYPERFLVFDKEKELKGLNFNFVPFGGGRRMCPGINMAFSLINPTIAAMVQCFDWKVDGDENGVKVSMEVKSGFIMAMAHPLLCIPSVHFNSFTA